MFQKYIFSENFGNIHKNVEFFKPWRKLLHLSHVRVNSVSGKDIICKLGLEGSKGNLDLK